MLTDAMTTLIRRYSAGAVATVSADGKPSVSPKATFVVLDPETIAFGNLRSPGTITNLQNNPAVEVCFTDVLARKAVRVSGAASIVRRAQAPENVQRAFEDAFAEYVPRMTSFIVISIEKTELILSPAYDLGYSEAALITANRAKLQLD